MSRQSKPSDIVVTVEGVGSFTFARRSFRDQFSIAAEYARLSEGQPLAPQDDMWANMAATVRVLTVSAPEGWDIDTLHPDDGYATLKSVWSALSDKEKSFRRRVPVVGEGPGPDGGPDDGDVVQASV
jgi:hypothetical protein